MTPEKRRIYCKDCMYYYITWDKKFPHGCKLWGIKSMHMPSVVVYRSKGSPCEYFKKKKKE